MKQELSTTASINRTLRQIAIALVISGPVLCVTAVGGPNTEATSTNLLTEENGSTSVVIVEPGLIAAGARAAFSQRRYSYVRCNSSQHRRRTCRTLGRNPVQLWQQHSRASCVRLRDWNTRYGGEYVWVDNGCQATFRVRRR